MPEQNVVIADQESKPPGLAWLAGLSLIMLFDIAVLKWMWQEEIDHGMGIPPS